MDYLFLIGILGALILILGAAWNEGDDHHHPMRSIKNWLFATGSSIMLIYAVWGFLIGGSIFFVFLQILVAIASILMMLDTDDRLDIVVVGFSGLGLVIWSLTLFESYNTIVFIIGLSGVGFGYAFETGSLRRNMALTLGSLLIAIFSFIEASWVFFWLNVFFAIFSGYHFAKVLRR